jgi:hypothetical protein
MYRVYAGSPLLLGVLGVLLSERSTYTVRTRPWVIRVTNQSRPFRRSLSPTDGKA